MNYKSNPGDAVIVNHNNQLLTATVKAVQANGKVDCTITQRGKYFGSTVVFGQGDVKLAGDEGGADSNVREIHGSESYAEMANRVEREGIERPASADLGDVHAHIDEATTDLRADLIAALADASQEIRAHISSVVSSIIDRLEALEAKVAAAPPAAPASPAAPAEEK